jgi:YVTN family beta-propeller protein
VLNLDASGNLTPVNTIQAQSGSYLGFPIVDCPAGLAVDTRGYLYVSNNDSGAPTPSSVAIYDRSTNLEVGRYIFNNSYNLPSNFPLTITALSDGSKVYVASQRDGAVYVLNTTDPTNPTLKAVIQTGQHPGGLVLNRTQSVLYVTNAHSDSLSVVNTATDTVLNTVSLRPSQAPGLAGVTPTGAALSPDQNTLYIALSDMNAIAVVDTASLKVKGYVPAGWYPTAVAVSPDGKRLLFTNGKGTVTRHPNPDEATNPYSYTEFLLVGNVSTIPTPTASKLAEGTRQVIAANFPNPGKTYPEIVNIGLQAGKIKHVIYIVKENRTYDQVLGDEKTGNGDSTLTVFGKAVTPSQHALAERFALLDNFYCAGEVSFDGWAWSTESFGNEYIIKNVPYNYSGRGRNYDSEGQNNGYPVGGFPAKDVDGKPLSAVFTNGLPPIPDVAMAPAGHIWDTVRAAGLTYRNYGFSLSQGPVPVFPDNYPDTPGVQPEGHDLAGITDYDFREFDTDYADSPAPAIWGFEYPEATYGKYAMPSRYSEWKREFNEMLAKDPTGNAVPNFMTVRFMQDHTGGYLAGDPTPAAEVADNDYACGLLVQAISKSPIWNNTAIFIIEDDSQDGPDHVDSHRSTCYVISPYIKRRSVIHSFHNTDSVLKTIELLLGVPPLSQYDAFAAPLTGWDTAPNNNAPFTALLADPSALGGLVVPRRKDLQPGDPRLKLMDASAKLNLHGADRSDPQLLNEIIWKSVRGANAKMPAPRHTRIAGTDKAGRDDD